MPGSDLEWLDQSAEMQAAAVRDGRVTAAALTEAALDRIAQRNPELNALLEVDAEGARAQALQVDTARPTGALAGVPIAVKDNLCVAGLSLTAGSRFLEAYRAPYDATVVERLRQAGAVVIGKTNCDEFAMGSSTENSAFGPARNPHDLGRTPGGSSGGSAAAVAADLVPLALGSDTGGSIRQPAALTGSVGLKPTYGRVSRYGLLAFGSSLDVVGPHARTTRDAALCLQVLAGDDARDPTAMDVAVPDYLAGIEDGVAGLRVGVPDEFFGEGCDPEVAASVTAAVERLAAAGAEVVDVELPHTDYGIATYYVIAPCEVSSNLARFDGVRFGTRSADAATIGELYERSRGEGFGPEVRRRILLGSFALSAGYQDAYYRRAQRVRTLVKRDFERAFERCDVIAGPTSPVPAFRFGDKSADPLAMYLCDVYTVTANLAGIPGLSVPCGMTAPTADAPALPIGLQLLGPAWSEPTLLRAGRAVEQGA
ncbi:MAG: Asp-tRNA(Asn)/Glu-tRNA(Gln) amidotransferase subunit GatA [Planctomycetota bacterium]|jgi:aspartyl-tRNA(Asn)/glutamyl-tRNA(Gln) amidotransferase subunit A